MDKYMTVLLAVFPVALVLGISGCVTEGGDGAGLANPAAVYCEEQGWNVTITENELGQAGYCDVPGMGLCEEWALYRSGGSECIPPG
jgi:putative hemolysin